MRILTMDTQSVTVNCPQCGEYTIPLAAVTERNDQGPWSTHLKRDESLEPPRTRLWMRIRCGDLLLNDFPDCEDMLTVYWIDPFYLANNVAMDYVDGGHSKVYSFIRADGGIEIWIEDNSQGDMRHEQGILQHEAFEAHLMKNGDKASEGKGLEYEESHGRSQQHERLFRAKWRDPDYHGPTGGGAKT